MRKQGHKVRHLARDLYSQRETGLMSRDASGDQRDKAVRQLSRTVLCISRQVKSLPVQVCKAMDRKTGQLAAKEECQTLKKKPWFHKISGEG